MPIGTSQTIDTVIADHVRDLCASAGKPAPNSFPKVTKRPSPDTQGFNWDPSIPGDGKYKEEYLGGIARARRDDWQHV